MARLKSIGWLRISAVLTILAFAAFAAVGTRGTAMAQGDTSVSIVDFGFDPGSVTIDAGSTVTWTNTGNATHTVTSDDGAFDSGNLASGDSYSFTFDTPGTYNYHCAIHPNMTGTIVVNAAAAAGTTATETPATGQPALPATGSGPTPSTGGPSMLLLIAALVAAAGFVVYRRRPAR
jgi:plastocyanin